MQAVRALLVVSIESVARRSSRVSFCFVQSHEFGIESQSVVFDELVLVALAFRIGDQTLLGLDAAAICYHTA